jgi:mutator protein MutT
MYPGEFEEMFRKVASCFTLESVAQKKEVEGNFPKRNPNTPIWDTLDSLQDAQYVDIGNGLVVPRSKFFKIQVRSLFFILLVQFEENLFRIHQWKGKPIEELNESNINDLIRELVDSDLINLQREYISRSEFKEDLKAISSFRNVIMHVNKKLQRDIEIDVVVKRKRQINRILNALQQISDRMENKVKSKEVSIIIFYDSEGKLLLQSRKIMSKYGEEFGFFGGHIEKGETPEQALIREVKEELSYNLEDFKFFKKYGPKVYKESDWQVTHFVFLSKLSNLSKFKQNEGDSMELFSISDAKKLKLVSADYPILNDLELYFRTK